jgi:hypothetical protein
MKVGKEEIIGMLTAAEMWTRRDHEAEWNTWKEWLAGIEAKVKPLPSVTVEHLMPEDLSNHSPRLLIKWDRSPSTALCSMQMACNLEKVLNLQRSGAGSWGSNH